MFTNTPSSKLCIWNTVDDEGVREDAFPVCVHLSVNDIDNDNDVINDIIYLFKVIPQLQCLSHLRDNGSILSLLTSFPQSLLPNFDQSIVVPQLPTRLAGLQARGR